MLFKTEGRAWYKCQYVYVQNLNLKFRTKGNIVLHKANNETVETEIATQPEEDTIESNPSLNLESDNGWEDYLVERDHQCPQILQKGHSHPFSVPPQAYQLNLQLKYQ